MTRKPVRWLMTLGAMTLSVAAVRADNVLYRYEGNVLPYDASAGWQVFDECDNTCVESIVNGHFLNSWTGAGNFTNYTYVIAQDPEQPPPTLWVEFRFRSNETFPGNDGACDGRFVVDWGLIHDLIHPFGDAVFSASGDDWVSGLDTSAFHTYRFESTNGTNYTYSVDGQVFVDLFFSIPSPSSYLQMGGHGGCDTTGTRVNEWDYVRYGEISPGATLVGTDPPVRYVDPAAVPGFDRFTVTFDQPHYVYMTDITIETSGGEVPQVLRTWRLEDHEPDTLEIVLDRPLPIGQTTTITINDGTTTNVIVYTYAEPPPIPATSGVTLALFALALLLAATLILRGRRLTC